MNKEDIIRMAREAGMEQDGENFFSPNHEEVDVHVTDLERFAALVAAAKDAEHAEKSRYDIHSCGPDCQRPICVLVRKAVADEREACAKVCEEKKLKYEERASRPEKVRDINPEVARIAGMTCDHCAADIRARGNT